ncbi:MAG: tetratricopeptide repeat protein [Halofilum sp. (in: g-proteobacteria)]|nr:tetratricopeptide repeat protein [Halofilum sp. (in: g-proteobacteria)]
MLALRAGEHARAAEFFSRVQRLAPSGANVIELARALRNSDQDERALAVVEDWLQRHPGDAAVWLAAGDLHLHRGNEPGAISAYRSALDAAPESLPAMNNLAWLLREREPDEALGLARRAVEARPDAPAVRDTLGMVLLAQGRSEEAVDEFRKALEGAPEAPESALLTSPAASRPRAARTKRSRFCGRSSAAAGRFLRGQRPRIC